MSAKLQSYIGTTNTEKYYSGKVEQIIKNSPNSLEMDSFLQYMFNYAWYASSPCFDLVNITSLYDGQSSLVRNCKWKNVHVACSDLFTTFPTQMGMCCSFNFERADKLFTSNVFIKAVTERQEFDRSKSFQYDNSKSTILNTPKPGIVYGLSVRLDSQYYLYDAMTYKNNFNSFTVYLGSSPSVYPTTEMQSLKILKGHNNIIGISGTLVTSDAAVQNYDPSVRGCCFSFENSLKLFSQYTYSNCLFECILTYATQYVQDSTNMTSTGTPWFFPRGEKDNLVSGFMVTTQILDAMNEKSAVRHECKQCLPDCTFTKYSFRFSSEPFRKCDDLNFLMSPLCKIRKSEEVGPYLWSTQVKYQLNETNNKYSNLSNQVLSGIRDPQSKALYYEPVFSNTNNLYDAFETDIAYLTVFFDEARASHFQIQPSYTWASYFSIVAGIYGLCFGLCLSTIFEFIWLFIQLFRTLY